MTRKEKKAIKYLTRFTEYTRKNSKKQYRFDSQYAKDLEKRVEMFEPALNLIQRQQEEIEELKRSDIKQSKIECLEIQLKKKDKIIDKMAEYLASIDFDEHCLEVPDICMGCPKEDDLDGYMQCIKQYFERKVEDDRNN